MRFKIKENLFKVTYEGKEGYVITENRLIIENEYYVDYINKNIHQWQMNGGIHENKSAYCDVIIASTFTLGNLPQFVIGEDIQKLAIEEHKYNHRSIKEVDFRLGFEIGWNKHAEKYKFTEEDVKKAIQLAREADSIDGVVDLPIVLNYPNADNSDLQIKWMEEEIIQFLQQPKEIIEIEFETEEYPVGNYGLSDGESTIDTRLKITKSIKYPNGLLTIKNVKYE